jgi:TorA maturation chaperone TorD
MVTQQDAEARGNMYRFLSTVYLRPLSRDGLRRILAPKVLEELASVLGEDAVAALKHLATTAPAEKDLASLKQEYMALFAVPTGRYVSPFEDVYREHVVHGEPERGLLLGKHAIAVRRLYRKAGAQIERTCKELPTHIGVELAFMSFLCDREAAAIRHEEIEALQDHQPSMATDASIYRALQRRFLQEHLNVWFPHLSRAIQAHAKSHLYRGLAQITEAFLARDTVCLVAGLSVCTE